MDDWYALVYDADLSSRSAFSFLPRFLADERCFFWTIWRPVRTEDVVEPDGRLPVYVWMLPGVPRQKRL